VEKTIMKSRIYIDTSVVGGFFDRNPKDFDCVEMKNAIQAQIYAEIKDMTKDEILTYFNNPSIKKGVEAYRLTRRNIVVAR
jgi:hypothetical protein